MFEGHTLNPAQEKVARHGILSSGFNCVLQLPTGSGKTWLAERTIEATLNSGQRAIYLTPLRALATELLEKWSETFSQYKVGVFTGEYGKTHRFPVSFDDAQLLIMTPERLDACTRNWRRHWNWIPDVDLVIVDELHLLGEPGRGPRLEGGLMRFTRLNPFARIVGLSATLGNRIDLADWLDGVDLESTWRPVPLSWRVRKFRKATEKPQLLLDEVQQCVAAGGQSLVFVQSRRRAEQLAKFLCSHGLHSKHHHAGLNKEDRNQTELQFRERNIQALISTGTLEMGLNLPARQVILFDLQRFNGWEFEPLSTNTVWQRGGRAGRRGLDDQGEVVLIAAAWEKHPQRYLKGSFEPIESRLTEEWALAEQLIAEVGSGLSRNTTQLRRTFGRSLAGHQRQKIEVQSTIDKMVKSDMLREVEQEHTQGLLLKPTRLGRIAVRQMLSPTTILRLAKLLNKSDNIKLTLFDLILISTTTADCTPRIPVDFEELEEMERLLGHEISWLLSKGLQFCVEYLDIAGRKLLACLKTALIARRWTRTGEADQVAEKFACYPFEVNRLAEGLERVLTAALAITKKPKDPDQAEDTSVKHPVSEEPELEEKIDALKAMITYGIDEQVVTLTFIPGIGGTLARRLLQRGICDIEDLALTSVPEIAKVKGISERRAVVLVDVATEFLGDRPTLTFRESGAGLHSAHGNWPSGVDPYRLRRAIELDVAKCSTGSYLVSGGLEPHQVNYDNKSQEQCDCADFAKGNYCKHLLAVRLSLDDRDISKLTNYFNNENTNQDLLSLWLSGRNS